MIRGHVWAWVSEYARNSSDEETSAMVADDAAAVGVGEADADVDDVVAEGFGEVFGETLLQWWC